MTHIKTLSHDPSRRGFIGWTAMGGLAITGLSGLNSLAYGRTTPRMPTLFVGHGDPFNIVADNSFTRDWERIAATLPRPAAILTVSAHWETDRTTVVTAAQPKTIHDFYGFPDLMYQIQYPAPGAPQVARDTIASAPAYDILETEEWGLDHGAWCVLARMFPNADVPVFQLSLGKDLSPQQHFALASELSSLRDKGVLIVGSGNVVHNMISMRDDYQSGRGEMLHDWAQTFDETVRVAIESGDFAKLADVAGLGAGLRAAHPTLEHYLPLLYSLGSAGQRSTPQFFAEGFEGGSFSMRSVVMQG